MRRSGLLVLVLLLGLAGLVAAAAEQFPDVSMPFTNRTQRTRIAFGSCSKQTHATRIWEVIGATEPEMWIWLGDAVYQDTMRFPGRFEAAPPARMEEVWQEFKASPGYGGFLARRKPVVLGTWDDHDFGLNGGGAAFPWKQESQQLFLDFLGVPRDDEVRRNRAGVYNSYEFGADGQRILVVLLDNRYHLDEDRGLVLGEEQWQWFEKTLRSSQAQLILIGAGIQMLTVAKPGGESWGAVGDERARLVQLIHDTKVNTNGRRTILVSGDVHFSEFMCSTHPASIGGGKQPTAWSSRTGGDPLVEFTSSGLTHSWRQNFVSPVLAWPARTIMNLLPNPYALPSTVPPLAPLAGLEHRLGDPELREHRQKFSTRLAQRGMYFSNGFGVIDVDFAEGLVHLQTLDEGGRVHLHQSIPFRAAPDTPEQVANFHCGVESPFYNQHGRRLALVVTVGLIVGLPWAAVWLLLNKVLGVSCCVCCLRRRRGGKPTKGDLGQPRKQFPEASDAKAKQS